MFSLSKFPTIKNIVYQTLYNVPIRASYINSGKCSKYNENDELLCLFLFKKNKLN